jgi:hypothetical protein
VRRLLAVLHLWGGLAGLVAISATNFQPHPFPSPSILFVTTYLTQQRRHFWHRLGECITKTDRRHAVRYYPRILTSARGKLSNCSRLVAVGSATRSHSREGETSSPRRGMRSLATTGPCCCRGISNPIAVPGRGSQLSAPWHALPSRPVAAPWHALPSRPVAQKRDCG